MLGIFQSPLRVMRIVLTSISGKRQAQSLIDQLFCQDLFLGLLPGGVVGLLSVFLATGTLSVNAVYLLPGE